MAIIKAVKGGKSLSGLLSYVEKKAELVSGKDCPDDKKQTLEQMRATKELYAQIEGRQYKHYIQSFEPGEVTPEKSHQIGREWAENNFKGYEVYIATHTDKKHIHNHFVVNSVNFENGKKIQVSKQNLEQIKGENDRICKREGLSTPEQGKELGQVRAYDRNKYQLLQRVSNGENIRSYLLDTAIAISNALEQSGSKELFIKVMNAQKYQVDWQDHKKHIVYTDQAGNKVRANNLEKTFSDPKFGKEGMKIEFEQFNEQNKHQQIKNESREQTREHTRRTIAESISSKQSGVPTVVKWEFNERNSIGEQLAQASFDRVKKRLSSVKERAGCSIASNSTDNNHTRRQDKVITRGEHSLGR